MIDLISLAINNRQKIQFYYDGGLRVVEAHAVGYGKDGHPKLRGYQVEGYSSSGNITGWKLFNILKIEDLVLLNSYFIEPRSGYNPVSDKHIPQLINKI